MKNKRFLLAAIIMVLSLLLVPACDDGNDDTFHPKEYSVKVDYIGTDKMLSENVKNINVYTSVEAYVVSDTHNDVLWISDDIYDFDADTVRSFLKTNDTVIVLSTSSKSDVISSIMGTDAGVTETQQEKSFPLGVMFTNVTDSEGKEAVGLFTKKQELGANIDFLAFCSEYDYGARYQSENMITEYQKTQKLNDVFNVYNLREKAYAVSYMTIVDFTDNPTVNANKTKYMYTLWSYTDVVSVNNRVSGFESVVDTGKDSYVVSYSPESDRKIAKGEDVSANFFYGRYYKASYATPSEGMITSLYKGYGDVKAGWKIALTEGKKGTENYVREPVNLTGIADIISLTGCYMPSCNVVVYSLDSLQNKQELTFGYSVETYSAKLNDKK